jgi:hypothetical protein
MVYFGPVPEPPKLTKLPALQGRNLPIGELIKALRMVETSPFRALRCCRMCEVYWLVPHGEPDDPPVNFRGLNFVCPECAPPDQGPYR